MGRKNPKSPEGAKGSKGASSIESFEMLFEIFDGVLSNELIIWGFIWGTPQKLTWANPFRASGKVKFEFIALLTDAPSIFAHFTRKIGKNIFKNIFACDFFTIQKWYETNLKKRTNWIYAGSKFKFLEYSWREIFWLKIMSNTSEICKTSACNRKINFIEIKYYKKRNFFSN